MKLTCTQFRERINNRELYFFFAQRYRNKHIYIPKPISSKYLLVKALLLQKVHPIDIHRKHKISYSYVRYIKSNLIQFCQAEKLYEHIKDQLFLAKETRPKAKEYAQHLINTCGGCSVYFKYKRLKLSSFIIKYHTEEAWTPEEIKAQFDGDALESKYNDRKQSCTLEYIKKVIRNYQKDMDPFYLPKRTKRTDYHNL